MQHTFRRLLLTVIVFHFWPLLDRDSVERQERERDVQQRAAGQTQTRANWSPPRQHMIACSPTELNQYHAYTLSYIL